MYLTTKRLPERSEVSDALFTKKHFSLPVLGNVVSYQIWPEPLQGSNDGPQTLRCDVLVSIHVYDDEDSITSYGIGGLVLSEVTVLA
jgi:hypothetical protein